MKFSQNEKKPKLIDKYRVKQQKEKRFNYLLTLFGHLDKWGAFNLFIADFFASQIIGGAKGLVVLL